MSLEASFFIAASGMRAQSQRLNVVSSNLANADSATSSTGLPYRARQVVFEAKNLGPGLKKGPLGVVTKAVTEDPSPPRLVYDPRNPYADEHGYVAMPNVNAVEEMVNMISTSRSYQMNTDMMNTAKNLLLKTLSLGQIG